MSEKRARELGVPAPVPILGFGQGQTLVGRAAAPRPDRDHGASVSAQTAFRMAGLAPKDIDVAQIYDCFTITVLMTLEDYGFCSKGEGGALRRRGRRIAARRRTADQHQRRAAVRNRHAGPAARAWKACARCAARSINQVKDARKLHRQQPGRHHAHALDADPGPMSGAR